MKPDISDMLVIVGVGLIGLGAYFIYPPAAALIVGIFCLLGGLLSAGARARKRGEKT